MARGWESKSVESQIESAANEQKSSYPAELNTAQLDLIRKKESLVLSRTRIRRELETCRNPRYRDVLDKALKALDVTLSEIDRKAGTLTASS